MDQTEVAMNEAQNSTENIQTQLQEEYLKSLETLEEGQLVDGTVIQVTPEQVFIDVGYKSEGKIPTSEFSELPKVGDTVSVVLIAAMLPMALALEKTGASQWVSQMLVGKLGGYSPYILLASIYFTTSLLTMFISNTATAILVAPIAMSAATSMGISPLPFLIAVSVGASMCFASPFSTPPNALVMSAGRYTFMDYVKVGLPLQILMGIVMVLALPLLFPF